MPAWLNASSGIHVENGTNTHVIPLGFTATAGRLLVVIIGGQVTHTVSAGGWTERLQPVDSTELSVFTKVAAGGETSITDVNNGPDYPVSYAAFEFPAGSTYAAGVGVSHWSFGANPDALTGLPGTAVTVFGAADTAINSTSGSFASTWSGGWTKFADVFRATASTGTGLAVGYIDGVTATSSQQSRALSGAGIGGTVETVTFAISVAAQAETHAGTLTLSGTGTSAVTGSPKQAGRLTRDGTGAAALTGAPRPAGSLARTGAGTATPTGSPRFSGPLARSGEGTARFSGLASFPVSTGAGFLTLTGTGTVRFRGVKVGEPAAPARGFRYGEAVTRLRPAQVTDPYSGHTVPDWSAPAEQAFTGVAVEPVPVRTEAATRPSEARSLVPVSCRLYVPDTGADVRAGDRWRARGRVFRTAGEPAIWRSPLTGWAPGIVIELSSVEDD